MKKIMLLSIFGLLFVSSSVAQKGHFETLRRNETKIHRETELQRAADLSATAKLLKAKVDAQEEGAILDAAKTGDTSLIPFLKLLAANEERRSQSGTIEFEAHVALALLGHEEAVSEIFVEIEPTNRSPTRLVAIGKLALLGSKAAYRKLVELLDDHYRPPSEAKDMFYTSVSDSTMSVLALTVKDPPTGRDGYSVEAWKAWFKRNKHLID